MLEYCAGGSLRRYLEGCRGGLDERTAQPLLYQITSALVCMHKLGVAHRDVKPDNLLFVDSRRLSLKLCDFGFATVCGDQKIKGSCGTPLYMPPELTHEGRLYLGLPVDIWAVGAIAYEMVHGALSYGGSPPPNLLVWASAIL